MRRVEAGQVYVCWDRYATNENGNYGKWHIRLILRKIDSFRIPSYWQYVDLVNGKIHFSVDNEYTYWTLL